MVGILLIAHGSLAEGFARSAEMIMGDDFPNTGHYAWNQVWISRSITNVLSGRCGS